MIPLYGALIAMLSIALGILVIPFRKYSIKRFLVIALLFAMSASGFYLFSGDKTGLVIWMVNGKKHYQLQEKFKALGGVTGAIAAIEKRVANNPQDAQGWQLLGKLYLMNHENEKADRALARGVT